MARNRENFLDKVRNDLYNTDKQFGSPDARKWLRGKINSLGRITPQQLLVLRSRHRQNLETGRMYFYLYDAKTKDKLPYWDKFPLTLPIEGYSDGFLGLNFHYLPYKARLFLIDNLHNIQKEGIDNRRIVKASYSFLKASSQHKAFKPCLKRYLYTHIRSQFIEIPTMEWDICLMLNVAQFTGASQTKVWSDSMRKI